MDIEAMPSDHWDQQAKKARDKARTMASAEAKRLMREVARHYRLMAAIASKRGAHGKRRALAPPASASN